MPEALYRKYRPQVFEDVVGQESIEHTLKNALQQNKVSHAYLFTGPRGTGKTTMARLLAKALMCEQGPTPTPDGTCEDCRLIADGAHPDVYELDAASRTGVENVRDEIISRVGYAPTRGNSKVYIIDEVHMLSTAAFNALLKTLEEPPAHVVFILCTTDPQKVPETIHSRCQRFDFRRIAPEAMVTRLGAICVAEGVEFEGEALDLIAQRAEGGLRNALTSLEQIITYEDGKVTLAGAERLLGSIDSNDLSEIMAHIGTRNTAECFRWVADYVETGADLAQFVSDMAEHVRNLYILALAGDDAVLDVSETARLALANELQWFGPDRASRMLGVLGDLSAELKVSSNPRLSFEIAITRLVRPESDLTLEGLAERIECLERLEAGIAAATATAAAPVSVTMQSAPAPAMHAQAAVVAPAAEAIASTEASMSASMQASEQGAAPTTAASSPARADEQPVVAAEPQAVVPEPAVETVAHEGGVAQPQEQPVSSATTAGPSVDSSAPAAFANPAAVQRTWQQALAGVKRAKQAYSALFMNVKAAYDAPSAKLLVTFPAQSQFAFNAVQKPEATAALADALEKAAGQPVAFEFLIAEEQSQPQPQAQTQAGGQVQAQPQVQVAAQPQPQTQTQTQSVEPQAQAQAQAQAQVQHQPTQPQPDASARQQAQSSVLAHEAQPVLDEPGFIDEVPLDVYEQEEGFAPADAASSPAAIADANNPNGAASGAPNNPTTSLQAVQPEASSEAIDFDAVLKMGFGDDVSFEEVR